MAMFPEVQRKAQAELDRVVGHSRLPEFSDLQSLVYVRAVILEALRWMPAVPLGIPHYLTEDDEYKGYFLPKGSTVVYVSNALLFPSLVMTDIHISEPSVRISMMLV